MLLFAECDRAPPRRRRSGAKVNAPATSKGAWNGLYAGDDLSYVIERRSAPPHFALWARSFLRKLIPQAGCGSEVRERHVREARHGCALHRAHGFAERLRCGEYRGRVTGFLRQIRSLGEHAEKEC